MASQISTVSSNALNILQEYHKDMLVEGKKVGVYGMSQNAVVYTAS